MCEDENFRLFGAPPKNWTPFNLFYLRRSSKDAGCNIAGKLNYRAAGIEIFSR
jgi:hypothetical protein